MSRPNQRSTWLIQDEPVGVKCMWKRGCLASHSVIAGVLWVARLSQIRCTSNSAGTALSMAIRKLLELHGPVLGVQLGDDRAVGDGERREQAGDAVAGVIVGAALGHAGHHR